MNHIMIDIETLGRRNDAAIREVGLVAFKEDGTIIDSVQLTVSHEAWNAHYRTFSGETIQWLLSQHTINIEANCQSYEVLTESIDKFFIEYNGKETRVWSKGHMDLEVIKDLYEELGKPLPWEYWQPRDLRTILDLVPLIKKPVPNAQPHRAVGDAIYQVNQLCIALPLLMSKNHEKI